MERLRLLRKDGKYYINMDEELIEIYDWEAAMIAKNHQAVYDVIVDHRRKYNFNTAEDRPDSLL